MINLNGKSQKKRKIGFMNLKLEKVSKRMLIFKLIFSIKLETFATEVIKINAIFAINYSYFSCFSTKMFVKMVQKYVRICYILAIHSLTTILIEMFNCESIACLYP